MLLLASAFSMCMLAAFYFVLFSAMISALPESSASESQALFWSALLAGGTLVLTALLNSWLLDRLMKVQWVSADEAGDVGPYLKGLAEKHGIRMPRLGVAVDPNPYAMAYGLTRRGARLVVTSGLLQTLDVDEQCAVVAHETAHLVSGDFFAATFLATPIVMMTLVSDLFQGTRRMDAPPGTGMFLGPVAAALMGIFAALYGPLARVRERFADAFALAEGQARLEDARFRMVRGLGGAPPAGTAINKSFAMAARGFAPVDARWAGRWTTLAAARDGALTDEGLRETLAQARANPFASGDRGLGSGPASASVTDTMRRTATELQRQETVLRLLPLAGFLLGVGLVWTLRGYFGLPLVLWAVGRIVMLLRTHVLSREALPEGSLVALLEDLPRWWGCSFRATLEGKIVGYGIPAQTWSPDLVLETPSGRIAVRPRYPLGALQHFVSSASVADSVGQAVTVKGWVRVREVPFVEAHQVQAGGDSILYSGFVPLHLFISLLLLVVGASVLALEILR